MITSCRRTSRPQPNEPGPAGPVQFSQSSGVFVVLARLSIAWKLMLAAGCAIGALLLLAAALVAANASGIVRDLSNENARALAGKAAAEVASDIGEIQGLGRSMAQTLGAAHAAGIRDRKVLSEMIKPAASASPMILGAWFMEVPNALDGQDEAHMGQVDTGSNKLGQFTPYWVNNNGSLSLEPLDTGSDYEQPFYQTSFQSQKAAIVEPYPYEVGGKTISMTSVTFPVMSNGQLIGVAGIDLALDDVSKQLDVLRPFGDGRVMLVSPAANWVSHPDAKLRMKPYADTGVAELKDAMSSGKSVLLSGLDQPAGKVERLVTPAPLPGLNSTWAVVMDVPTAHITGPARQLAIWLAVGGVVILALVLGSLFVAVGKLVRQPLAGITAAVGELSAGRYDKPVGGADKHDEVGEIARALEGFRHGLAENRALRAGQEAANAQAESERRRAEAERAAVAEQQNVVVGALARALERLAQGDLTARVDAQVAPEYEALKHDFNVAMSQLQNTMGVVVGATSSMRSGCIEDITATVGVAKGTLYYHFSSKEEIFNFLVEEGIKLLQNSVDIKTAKFPNYIDKLKAIVLIQIKIVVKYEDLITILLSQFWGNESRNQMCKENILSYISKIEDIVREGIEKGEIKKGNPQAIASEIYGLICSSLVYKARSKEEIDIIKLYKEFENTIIEGLKINRGEIKQ